MHFPTLALFLSALPIAISSPTPQLEPLDPAFADWTYNKFPKEKATCPMPNNTKKDWPLGDLQELAIAASKGPIYAESAGNVGGAWCAGMYGIPYYAIGTNRGLAFMGVAVDRKNKQFTLCTLQSPDVNGDGYNENCDLDTGI